MIHITAIRLPDTRNKLVTEDKQVTYGMIRIIGHTDSDGTDAANLDLSRRRAQAVKNELAKSFGIDAQRMETDGKGETKPVEVLCGGKDASERLCLQLRLRLTVIQKRP